MKRQKLIMNGFCIIYLEKKRISKSVLKKIEEYVEPEGLLITKNWSMCVTSV